VSVFILALALLGCVTLPVVPIFLGVFLVVAAGLFGSSSFRPVLRPVLRVLVGGASAGRAILLALVGVVLVASGSMGATLRGHWRSEWTQRQERPDLGDDILERAGQALSRTDIEGAEFVLMEADRIDGIDPATRREIEGLLERIHRCGDAQVALEVLTGLAPEEFEAFEQGASVPPALQYEERALTYRSVQVARSQVEQARRLRARP
jgi:hypothetical protein